MSTVRLPLAVMLGLAWLGLVSCNNDRHRDAAREIGREAYHAKQDLKKGAKEAAHDLHTAGKQMREGWNEAKHENRDTRDTRRQ